MSHFENNDRLMDLLIQRATTGLSESEQQEFEQLASSPEHRKEAERFELTAAALDLSFNGNAAEPMPRELQDRLLIAAGDFFGHAKESTDPLVSKRQHDEPTGRPSIGSRSAFSWREAISLAVTAACLAVLLSGFNPFARAPGTIGEVVSQNLTPPQQLAAFKQTDPVDLVEASWTPVQDEDLGGKVFWSDSLQEGYMVLENLDINDPQEQQYQLWIFDTDKDQKFPVDGGVFDIASTDRVIIPIDARIPVNKAVRFAVTREKKGGVVVSDRQRLPGLADVESRAVTR